MERKPCRLLLTAPDGEVLERWSVEYDGKNATTHDLSHAMARDEVMENITQELRRYQLKASAQLTRTKAEAIWEHLTHSEKHGVRFGLFPAAQMRAAESEGYDSNALARALMEVAVAQETAR